MTPGTDLPGSAEVEAVSAARRQLRGTLAAASDDQLRRIVALLDALPERGAADRLLDGVRHRLVSLGLRRPMNFGRLLFTPLDGLIRDERDPPLNWVPRRALPVLIRTIQTRLGAAGLAVAESCSQIASCDTQAVASLGARLWPAAARMLPPSAPPGWAETGLPGGAYLGIAAACRSLWRHALPVRAALAPQAMGEAALIRRALQDPAREGERSFTPVVSALAVGSCRPGTVLRVAGSLEPRDCRHSLALLDRFLERGFDGLALPPAGLARRAEAAVVMAQDLRAATLSLRPGGDARIRRLEAEVAERCGEEFRRFCADALLRPLAEAEGVEAIIAVVAELEPQARALRRAADALASMGELACGGQDFGQVSALVARLQERWAPHSPLPAPALPMAPGHARSWA